MVYGNEIDVAQSGAVAFVAANDLHVEQGGGSALVAGNRITVHKGGGSLVASGAGISIHQGGAGIAIAPEITFEKSFVGLAVGKSVKIGEDSRVIIGSKEAAVLGLCVVAGSALARLVGRRVRSMSNRKC